MLLLEPLEDRLLLAVAGPLPLLPGTFPSASTAPPPQEGPGAGANHPGPENAPSHDNAPGVPVHAGGSKDCPNQPAGGRIPHSGAPANPNTTTARPSAAEILSAPTLAAPLAAAASTQGVRLTAAAAVPPGERPFFPPPRGVAQAAVLVSGRSELDAQKGETEPTRAEDLRDQALAFALAELAPDPDRLADSAAALRPFWPDSHLDGGPGEFDLPGPLSGLPGPMRPGPETWRLPDQQGPPLSLESGDAEAARPPRLFGPLETALAVDLSALERTLNEFLDSFEAVEVPLPLPESRRELSLWLAAAAVALAACEAVHRHNRTSSRHQTQRRVAEPNNWLPL